MTAWASPGSTASSGSTRSWAFPIATLYKFFDDQGNLLAAMATYYAFVAIFPLLLLASSIFGFVLQGRPDLQEDALNSALAQFPIIGDQLGRPEGLTGSVTAVVVGVARGDLRCARTRAGDPERHEHRLVGPPQQPAQPAS